MRQRRRFRSEEEHHFLTLDESRSSRYDAAISPHLPAPRNEGERSAEVPLQVRRGFQRDERIDTQAIGTGPAFQANDASVNDHLCISHEGGDFDWHGHCGLD